MPTIKSIGRKDANFGQLITCLHKQEGGSETSFTLLHNIFDVSPNDMKGIEQAFKENNRYRKKRKNGVK